jgi:septal ring factor EnvC (AmiA/AmiB activator)
MSTKMEFQSINEDQIIDFVENRDRSTSHPSYSTCGRFCLQWRFGAILMGATLTVVGIAVFIFTKDSYSLYGSTGVNVLTMAFGAFLAYHYPELLDTKKAIAALKQQISRQKQLLQQQTIELAKFNRSLIVWNKETAEFAKQNGNLKKDIEILDQEGNELAGHVQDFAHELQNSKTLATNLFGTLKDQINRMLSVDSNLAKKLQELDQSNVRLAVIQGKIEEDTEQLDHIQEKFHKHIDKLEKVTNKEEKEHKRFMQQLDKNLSPQPKKKS